MQIAPINNNSMSFGWLETYSVSHPKSKALVEKELKQLEKLGKKYNIHLYSQNLNGNEWLTACVAELGVRPKIYPFSEGFSRAGKHSTEVTDSTSVEWLVLQAARNAYI